MIDFNAVWLFAALIAECIEVIDLHAIWLFAALIAECILVIVILDLAQKSQTCARPGHIYLKPGRSQT